MPRPSSKSCRRSARSFDKSLAPIGFAPLEHKKLPPGMLLGGCHRLTVDMIIRPLNLPLVANKSLPHALSVWAAMPVWCKYSADGIKRPESGSIRLSIRRPELRRKRGMFG